MCARVRPTRPEPDQRESDAPFKTLDKGSLEKAEETREPGTCFSRLETLPLITFTRSIFPWLTKGAVCSELTRSNHYQTMFAYIFSRWISAFNGLALIYFAQKSIKICHLVSNLSLAQLNSMST